MHGSARKTNIETLQKGSQKMGNVTSRRIGGSFALSATFGRTWFSARLGSFPHPLFLLLSLSYPEGGSA